MARSAHQSDKPALIGSHAILDRPNILESGIGSKIFSDKSWNQIGFTLRLSDRQLEIVRAVFDDHTEFAIAANLHIAVGTVRTHLERLRAKLRIVTRVQLVLRVTEAYLKLPASPNHDPNPSRIGANRALGSSQFVKV